MHIPSLVNKARKPKFELHLKIYDLNNVPLVSGVSQIKWHLPHSIHTEHRGRTPKAPIANHRVDYNYGKVVPVRISIDKNNNLAECLIEFEVLQEFNAGGVRDEKISLGKITLNLSEYIEESEAILRETGSTGRPSIGERMVDKTFGHSRKRSSASGITVGLGLAATNSAGGDASGTSPTSTNKAPSIADAPQDVEDGVVRRYLMQESKVNSTVKISILMIQLDGERNFVAPPLKTAPVFGGIAGILAGEQVEDPSSDHPPHQLPALTKSRDASEVQDMYRRALAASWARQPGELPADACVEDVFSGGDGWKAGGSDRNTSKGGRRVGFPRDDSGSASGDELDNYDMGATLRPSDARRIRHHMRNHSGASNRSTHTVTAGGKQGSPRHKRPELKEERSGGRSRSESLASLATTIGSERGRDGFKRANEADEFEVRDDLVAWRLPEAVS
ncbi:putative respiratory complex assembly protein rmp1 protein [Phaeoacremonium minimum UCRPA7]|uniref:Putative respiratory complex assembly protein rmp1 protein n=1 Tax=Phaeoacremonium minimum (strain UCR-PA7) TaxID=1286976 RepID=R8BJT4_PHAM7|nr:putative respiratory complex assembly protein rmp1 protein [Phaeoacremonium minimum UCRPA7]EON99544.1 putative respiratory complex assembly protein rmp1 protein [Phaeoacremonium minimum UCRPA7]